MTAEPPYYCRVICPVRNGTEPCVPFNDKETREKCQKRHEYHTEEYEKNIHQVVRFTSNDGLRDFGADGRRW